MSMANKVLQLIQESGAKWVDFRFTDTKGKEQHVTYPADTIDEDTVHVLKVVTSQFLQLTLHMTCVLICVHVSKTSWAQVV